MNNDLIERLKELMAYYNLNQSDFAKRIGVRQPNLSAILNGERPCGQGMINKILLSFDINKSWLLNGDAPMLNPQSDIKPDVAYKDPSAITYIPLIPADAFAGPIARLLENGVTDSDCRSIISPVAGAEMAIPVSGDSMEPAIHDGSILYIGRINDRAFIPWGNIMVVDTENGALVKELYPVEGDNSVIQARSLNTKYPPFNIPKSSIRGIYRVLGIAKFHTTL